MTTPSEMTGPGQLTAGEPHPTMPTYLGMPPFPAAARTAVADSQLRANLTHATHTIRAKRAGAVAELADWEQLRQAAKAIKDHTLAHLDTYLLRLEENVTRAGGQVHWAQDAGEANAIVAGLVRAAGADSVVKVKSMATQETGLNEALAADGIGALETDLAELIVQLGHDRPSHILVPAIHRNRAEIREIFRNEMPDAPAGLTDDPAALAAAARSHLRQAFLSAQVGVSGANFAIAETGLLVVVESEGNGRMCVTLPRTLISVVGVEKILPSWRDLEVFLALLPRSSTAERMNPYTSTWTGITPGDGPENFHLVLLDNGRTSALADPTGRQALRCIRCSACLNVCPVYERTGGHAYGSPYPGPIGAIISPLLRGVTDPVDASLPFASTLCGACYRCARSRSTSPRPWCTCGPRSSTRNEKRPFPPNGWLFPSPDAFSAHRGCSPRPSVPRGKGSRLVARSGRIRRLPPPLARLDRDPRRPRPAAGVLPRLVGPDEGWPVVSAFVRKTGSWPGSARLTEPPVRAVALAVPRRTTGRRADPRPVPEPPPTRPTRRCPVTTCGPTTKRRAGITGLFAERAADYRAVVERVPGSGRAAGLAAAVARVLAARAEAVPGSFVIPDGLPAGWLAELPGEITLARDEPPMPAAELDRLSGVVTGCAVAIAETGTIILDHGPGQGRRALTLVPDFHLVVVGVRSGPADLADAFARLDPGRPHTLSPAPRPPATSSSSGLKACTARATCTS